jgi:hypothetical protein
MKFRDATDQLFRQIDHGALAEKLHVSIASIRQARLRPESLAHRAPPKEWERAVASLAEQQIEHYRKLADTLRKEKEQSFMVAKNPKKGRSITD